MVKNKCERCIFHGSIVILFGLVVGLLTAVGLLDEAHRGWGAAHLAIITTGIWILAMASVFPLLVLPKRETSALVWSLLAAGYGVIVATPIEIFTGIRAIEPIGPVTNWIAFIANVIFLAGATFSILLTLRGVRTVLKGRQKG